ncbi:MAG: PP2C family serine/threonine-protein phosphatase [Bacteroidales bacterium]|nr:serine/threonine-protein phosphatase [Tenuifilaceae bacterium]
MLLKFDISAFTHVGTVRKTNQDHILVNGQIFNEGEVHLVKQNNCICFVADGVGGNKAGDFASHFVLDELRLASDFSSPNIEHMLHRINENLISISKIDNNLTGTATTLTGLVIRGNIFKIIHAGDSQIWLLRNDMFFQVTKDQVLDEFEKNSPITSYFGGNENFLRFDTDISIQESLPNDIFLICSDGLFKSLNQKILKAILIAEKDHGAKAKKILENCLKTGAEDNTSVILIKQTI